jgi:hypothetical protein
MGYGVQIPAHQLGGPAELWVIGGYGLCEVWDTRCSKIKHSPMATIPEGGNSQALKRQPVETIGTDTRAVAKAKQFAQNLGKSFSASG